MKSWRSITIHAAVTASAALLIAACGDDGSESSTAAETTARPDASGTRTIEIDMRDIAFAPDSIEVRQGETVRFVFTNSGAIVHDAFLGDDVEQDDHEMEMQAEAGDGGMGHGDAGDEAALTLQPGESGELTYSFTEDTDVLIGCHQPGHYEAGMKISIDVS